MRGDMLKSHVEAEVARIREALAQMGITMDLWEIVDFGLVGFMLSVYVTHPEDVVGTYANGASVPFEGDRQDRDSPRSSRRACLCKRG